MPQNLGVQADLRLSVLLHPGIGCHTFLPACLCSRPTGNEARLLEILSPVRQLEHSEEGAVWRDERPHIGSGCAVEAAHVGRRLCASVGQLPSQSDDAVLIACLPAR